MFSNQSEKKIVIGYAVGGIVVGGVVVGGGDGGNNVGFAEHTID